MADASIYQNRMNDYFPQIIQKIKEFQGIIEGEHPEFEELEQNTTKTLNQAYLGTMDIDRITQWEKMLNILPVLDSSVEDRRDTIIARIRGQGKLNTALINSIVNTFTGGTANSWIADSILYIEITPSPDNKQYQFANIEQEISKKIPAHMGLQISRNYFEWGGVSTAYQTWQDVYDNFTTWNDVFIYVVPQVRR